ncbi:carbohydrate ABC transporter membrane protein 2 (CUT1 family) [Microterricola gilva]|uniref:Carbohydrate ABC transporter membrane protein 2 (CUT1 family) n=1 Tax=Microterricola gilva TaxID=393267 RepID=A0A4Q8AJM7_9MICO|nr:carbohydrate ABC transporter permease [Microterricola gilva]RZU64035.1 carbohydrate ABC transporter membrane protein 2 (CUT1 family) [Microterricola gilva]
MTIAASKDFTQQTDVTEVAATQEHRAPRRRRRRWSGPEAGGASPVRTIIALVVTAVFIYPIYLVLLNAFKSQEDIYKYPGLPVMPLTLQNFVDVFTRPDGLFWTGLINSIQITVIGTLLSTVIAAMMAHYMVRSSSWFAKLLWITIPLGLMIPQATTLLPLLRMLDDFHLIGSIFGLIIVYVAGNLPFGVLVFSGFMRTIPKEIEEAAAIDGAGPIRTFWAIVFPLLRPAAASVIIFLAVGVWNDFITPLIILGPGSGTTVTVGMYRQISQYVSNYGAVFAYMVLATIPIVILFIFLQKYFVKGLTSGAAKG